MRVKYHFALALAAALVAGAGTAPAEERIDYLKQIKPLLAERCYACHGALKQEGGLRLDTAAHAKAGSDSGAVIVPGDVAASRLVERISAKDDSERMPPEGSPLKPEQIATLKAWIAQNAEGPADEQPDRDPREHWSFRPLVKPPVPQVGNAAWVRNPIDAFVAARHEQLGLVPQIEAPRELRVRRIYMDLVGMPPSATDLVEIDADTSADWYPRLVERLLADPRHGERWARHWMDIWRYSDWWGLGGQQRNSHVHIWHWRDWIVESLNGNLPYDEMIRLMLAADELHPTDESKLRATGFLARNWSLYGRNLWMEESVEHVSKGFLGLTINCAKCHDHKYDPIAQTDYYRMRAFFEPHHVRLDIVPGENDLNRDGIPRVFDGWLDKPTYRFERGQENQPDKSVVMEPGVPKLLECGDLSITPVSLPKESWQPARRTGILDTHITAAQKAATEAESALAAAREKMEAAQKQQSAISPMATFDDPAKKAAEAAVTEACNAYHPAFLAADTARLELASVEARAAAMRAAWVKQDASSCDSALDESVAISARDALQAERRAALAKARQAVGAAEQRLRQAAADRKAGAERGLNSALEALSKAELTFAAPITDTEQFTPLVGASWTPTRYTYATLDDPTVAFPPQSTGRRTALARWITDRRNPLTARVAVNHMWSRHFGAPLVPSVFDFGRKGTPPAMPELVDWLAAELIESDWDMKHIHRLITTSAVYAMSSSTVGGEANHAIDPDNRYLWRRSPIRVESQVVRDSVLALSGKLDLTRGGPSVPLDAQATSNRRSIYLFHSSIDRNLFLDMFDEASVNECYRRDQSIVPQQALALSNSSLVLDAARELAKQLSQPTGPDTAVPQDVEFITKAYYQMLNIRASEDEIQTSLKAIQAWRNLAAAGDAAVDRARENYVWALFNHNDFVTIR